MAKNPYLNIIAGGALITLIGVFISKLFNYAYRLIISRLGTENYGIISLATAITAILAIFTSIGLDFGVVRYVAYYKSKNDVARLKGTFLSAIKISLFLGIIFSVVLFFISDFISKNFFQNPNLSVVLKIFSLVLVFEAIRRIITETLRAFQEIKYYVITRNIIEPVFNFLLALLFIFLGYGLIGVSFAYVAAIFISFVVAFYLLEKKVFPMFNSKISALYENKELLSYSMPLLFSTALARFLVWLDIIFLGFFKTASDVGIYNTAIPTSQLLLMAPTIFLGLFVPVVTELIAKNNHEEIKNIYQTTTKWIVFINLPISIFFIINSREMLRILFGPEYSTGYIALIILTIGNLASSLFYGSRYMLDSLKKTRFILLNTIIITVINIILNLLLIPKYGIMGAAIATSSTVALFGVLNFARVYTINKINIFNVNYIKSIIATLIAILSLIFLFKVTGFKSLILSFVFFMVIYSVVMIITKAMSKDDIELIKTILRSKNITPTEENS